MNFPLLFSLSAAGGLFLTGTGFAATITWGISGVVSYDGDVKTFGTLVSATEVGGTTDKVINGVTFAGEVSSAGVNMSYSNLGSTHSDFLLAPSTDTYTEALDSGRYSDTASSPGMVTFSSLITGKHYLVQLWIVDTRTAQLGRISRVTDDTGATPFVLNNGGVSRPQWVIGTFTADSTGTQKILFGTFNADQISAVGPQLNLIQLRNIDVPEPTAAMLGLCALGSLGTQRRRRLS